MSGSDKTEKPTPKRKREARRKGQIARSPEVGAWASTLAASYLLPVAGGLAATRLVGMWNEVGGAIAQPTTDAMFRIAQQGMVAVGVAVLPLALGLMVVGVACGGAQTGMAVSPSLVKPKFERISPAKGLKKLLSPMSVQEAVKSLAKLAVVSWVGYHAVASAVRRLVGLPTDAVLHEVGPMALGLVRSVAWAGLVLAVADYALQRRRVMKGMRMSRQDIVDEHRQSEGDPHVKGAIRQRQLRIARSRMIADVKTADAVVVNPTHVAVAIKYQPGRGAPRVVAKGAGAVAARIRAEAEEHGVPMVQDVPLARTIYKACDVGEEIPPELFEAVARLLAFIYSLPATVRRRGTPVAPPRPLLATT